MENMVFSFNILLKQVSNGFSDFNKSFWAKSLWLTHVDSPLQGSGFLCNGTALEYEVTLSGALCAPR